MAMLLKQKTNSEEAPQKIEKRHAPSSSGIMLESVPRMFCPKCEKKMNTSVVKALSEGSCPACGEKIFVEGKVGPYRIQKLIGQGGMGAVYEGFDDGLGRKVAIKVTLVDVTRDPTMLATFQREAQAVAKLNHPNVVQVYAFGEEKGHPYLAMELLPSGSLMDRMESEEPVNISFLMGVAFAVVEGLKAAQEAGLLHGDVKPENILFDDKMHAKLVDFGIAAMQGSPGGGGEVWGTPYYIAPEKVLEQKATHKCDIYSLGATLYHVLAKRPPFDGANGTLVVKAALTGNAEPLSTFRPDLPPEVDEIIRRMMEKDASRRYPNYTSIHSDLKKYLATVPRETLRRVTRMAPTGTKKGSSGTRKFVIQGTALRVAARTSPLIGEPAEVALPKTRSKLPWVAAAIAVVAVLGIGGMVYRAVKAGRTEKNIQERAQTLDDQYVSIYAFVQTSYDKIGKIQEEAQVLLAQVEAQRVTIEKRGEELKKSFEQVLAQGAQVQTVGQEAEVLRNKMEHTKPEPLMHEELDVEQLELFKKELIVHAKGAKELKAKAEEVEGLLEGMKASWVALEATLKNKR